jgi:integrative and conjugative element protein (TIGR02256 family)
MQAVANKALVFQNAKGDRLKLHRAVVGEMCNYIQDKRIKVEAGGVLLGRYILNCEDVVVDKITKPMKDDRRSRLRFFRSARLHQQVINEAWISSRGTCNYLGEWHTHPEPDPSPSFIDLVGWRKKLLFDKFDSDVLYFVIAGTEQINAWQGGRKTLAIEKLHKVT